MPTRRRNGNFGPDRESWVVLPWGEWVLYERLPGDEIDPDDDTPDLDLSRLMLHVQGRRGRPITLLLSNLTVEELEVLREFVNRACDKARPVCEELDRRAAEAWENGDDSYPRQYRPVPRLIVRGGRESEHDSGVQS